MTLDPNALPADLPVPEDDGAADHLPGSPVPSVRLVATGGGTVDLAEQSRSGPVVVFAYPRTGRPGVEAPQGWDDIPGARGCTPEACSFRDLAADFAAAGAEVFGLSTQDPEYQSEAAERLRLGYSLLSDERLELASALRLPTFEVEGTTLLRRLTIVLREGRVDRVLYPVFPPDRAAADALAALGT
ncbi:peroxiredoxin [Geodermatophilus sp. YIM 151500]|uniref:peroxiredoxin n=1 Tax=Geodermatophilus sp. YIM 151500 TaxID=2984531 RepID=UPI0021E3D111|nr:peroxiredoxin [Geodermatophilus sp. YIM 151500]MCV2490681.1 peroxiredoxin [Geodermatophilus sp. YIM 151500]